MDIHATWSKLPHRMAATAVIIVIAGAALADAFGNSWRGNCVEERAHLGCVSEQAAAQAMADEHSRLTGHTTYVSQCD